MHTIPQSPAAPRFAIEEGAVLSMNSLRDCGCWYVLDMATKNKNGDIVSMHRTKREALREASKQNAAARKGA